VLEGWQLVDAGYQRLGLLVDVIYPVCSCESGGADWSAEQDRAFGGGDTLGSSEA